MYCYPYSSEWMSGLLGDPEVEELFDAATMLMHMLRMEAAVARIQASLGMISPSSAEEIATAIRGFEQDDQRLERSVARDGMVVPGLARQVRQALSEQAGREFHLGLTSQDLIDTAMAMAVARFVPLLKQRLARLDRSLERFDAACGSVTVDGYTRMQAAKPIALNHRIGVWRTLLAEHGTLVGDSGDKAAKLQLAGPVGTGEELGEFAPEIRRKLAQTLSLALDDSSWQTNRAALASFASACSSLACAIAKIGKDLALMAQLGDVGFKGGGTSSAMPHKSNPIGAETMIAIGHFAALLLPGMHYALMHEQERSGSMWTLEWMIFPQICVATGKSILTAEKTVSSVLLKR